MSINIVKCTSMVNTTAKSGRSIKYLVMHYTAGFSSKAGAAKNTASYFCGGSAGGSADFIVDDETIVQYNPDIKNRYCWAVGGSLYSSMTTSEGGKYYSSCNNTNCISIEICSNKTDQSSQSAYDTDWYFTDAVLEKAVELTKYLMEQYGIGIDNVIMHHHVTGKVCPNPWCVSEARLSQWYAFKEKLSESEDDEMVESGTIAVNGKNYSVNKILKDGKNYICLADLAKAGFDVGYDANSKIPSLDNSIKEINVSVDGENKTLAAVNIGDYNYCQLREVAEKTGIMEIDYVDKIVIINTK